MNLPSRQCPSFLRLTLLIAGVYNILWGASVVLFPNWFFTVFGMSLPVYPSIWQCVGMIVGVYGVGYILAAKDPYRHWIIVLVGFLGKIFGPIGFVYAVYAGVFPASSFITIVTNDLIWWIPFGMILYGALRNWASVPSDEFPKMELSFALSTHKVNGLSLLERSFKKPMMIVFLRHFGCVFCQQTIHELKRVYPQIREKGMSVAIVHSSNHENAEKHLEALELTDSIVVSDPYCELYHSFDLEKGSVTQLFGWESFWKGTLAFLQGHDVGKLQGDGFQLPGAFIVYKGQIIESYRSRNAADSPNFEQLLENSTEAA